MKEPYIKQLDEIADKTIFEIDGNYVRQNLSPEFTNFGQHYHYDFIPADEFWIDHGYKPSELGYFIDHMLTENKLMARGEPYGKAYAAAVKAEGRERKKASVGKKVGAKGEIVRKRAIPQFDQGKTKAYVVDGKAVRDYIEPDFVQGGNDMAWGFIPANEIWIDDTSPKDEWPLFAIHERNERMFMDKGKMSYEKAHRAATKIENEIRKILADAKSKDKDNGRPERNKD